MMATLTATNSTTGAWESWAGDTSGTSTWAVWASGTGCTTNIANLQSRELSAEEREQMRLEDERRRQDEARRAEERRQADARADGLLLACLTPAERKTMEKMAALVVRSQTGRTFRLRRSRSRNVDEMDADGNVIARFCIHPQDHMPHGDLLLAQKLMLETDEAEFLRIANRG